MLLQSPEHYKNTNYSFRVVRLLTPLQLCTYMYLAPLHNHKIKVCFIYKNTIYRRIQNKYFSCSIVRVICFGKLYLKNVSRKKRHISLYMFSMSQSPFSFFLLDNNNNQIYDQYGTKTGDSFALNYHLSCQKMFHGIEDTDAIRIMYNYRSTYAQRIITQFITMSRMSKKNFVYNLGSTV